MTLELIVGVLLKIAQDLLTAKVAERLASLAQLAPIDNALRSMAHDPEVDAELAPLTKWAASSEFQNILERMAAGERDVTDDAAAELFIATTDFYAGEPQETLVAARALLRKFGEWIEYHLYGSKAGHYLQMKRLEQMHREEGDAQQLILQTAQDTHTQVAEIAKAIIPPEGPADQKIEEKALHGRVDVARNLITSGKTNTARGILESIRADLQERSPSAELQFRVATNLGACLIDQDETAGALVEFERARTLKPENAQAQANAATAAIGASNSALALEYSREAISLEPKDPHVRTVRVWATHEFDRSECERLVDEIDFDEAPSELCLMLGQLYLGDGRYEDAEKWLRRGIALSAGSEHPDAHSLLAVAIFRPIQSRLMKDPPHVDRIPPTDQAPLQEAEDELSTAINELKSLENRSRLVTALSNRAGIRSLLGEALAARDDLDWALREAPKHSEALFNRALLAFLDHDEEAAIKFFRRISDHESNPEVVLPLAASLETLGSHQEAIQLLKPFWRGDVIDRQQLRVADLLLHIYARLEPDELVNGLLRTLEDTVEKEPRCFSLLGRYSLRRGATEEGISLLRNAAERLTENAGEMATLELADELRKAGRAQEAVEAYGDLVDTSQHTPMTERYLLALYEAKAYKEAYELAQELRGGGSAIPVITEIEIYIREYMGDLQTATALLLQLAKVTGDQGHILNAVSLELRQDRRDEAEKLLQTVNTAELKTPDLLMQCAHAKAALGHPGVLELAYEARRGAFRNPDIHLAFVWLFLDREKDEEERLNPERVDVGTAAKLRKDHDEKVFVILDDEDLSLERGELSPDDDLAQKLLGKRAGEQAVLKATGLEDLAYEVVEVQSKYVAAFQQTLLNFTTWWPTHPALQKVDFKDNDFTKILGALDARERLISQVMHAYREQGLPLGTISEVTGGSPLDVWRSLVGVKDQTLLVASGRPDDLQEEQKKLQNVDEIIIELSGVLTIALLNMADAVMDSFKKVVVAQATRDAVLSDYSKHFEGAVASSVMAKHEGQYFHHDITDEEREGTRGFLQRARDFLARCETSPAAGALQMGPAQAAKITELVGAAAAATVLAAKSTDTVVWIDDLPLKNVARSEWKVEGFSVQPVLQMLRGKGIVSSSDYIRDVRELVLANYFHIAVTAEDLWTLLEDDDFEITSAWTTVIQRTLGPTSDLESSVMVAAALLRHAWLSGLPDPRKALLLDAVLTAVVGQRPNPTASAAALGAATRQAFVLLPLHLDPILQSIDLWSRT